MTFFELYVVNPSKQRGIQCRFGMEGTLAEAHFDGDRNFSAVLGSERRYVLGHPQNCKDMLLYDQSHPMERHSMVDWSAPNLTAYPEFQNVRVNEVVLQAGDVLYIPTHWFHQIVSLTLNYQCNARSGYTAHYEHLIRQCGFHYKPL
jgi:ribosomal protein L16 Arg81 hydroxylase